MEDKKKQTVRKRIFINEVDRYSSKHIAKFLSTRVVGESSEEAEAEDSPSAQGPPAFDIVGTVSKSCKDEKQSFILEQYVSPAQDELLERLLECDVVVYNISDLATQHQVEEATWAITALVAEMDNMKSRIMFILISTVMTWAMTKSQNPNEIDAVLAEEEFRRRRPHPSFREHYNLEKIVLKLPKGKKSKLNGYVLASGLQYGKGESLFHYFFKVSWSMQLPKVPLFGEGTNYIPMIHITDLAKVIHNIIEIKPKSSKCILAVDDSKNTLEDIVKMISDTLGPGKVNKLPEQEAINMNAFKLEELECLSINLRLDGIIIKDSFNISWTSEGGIMENMERIVEEYKVTRQLLPIRISFFGPPAVGKTTIAEKVCSHYQIHHIKVNEVIAEKIVKLTEIANGTDTELVSDEEASWARKQMENITKSMETNAGRLADYLLFDIMKEKLHSRSCQNQGFLLDGFLKTYEQAKLIFSEEDMDGMSKTPLYNKKITPEHVIALNATDEFLTERVQGLPQNVAEAMRYTQEKFLPRLTSYRLLNATEECLLDYFDELEIHLEHIDVSSDDSENTEVIKRIIEIVGVTKNFGLSAENQEEEDNKREEERKQKVAAEKKRRNEAELAKMTAQYEDWQKNLSEVTRQEHQLLEAHSLPLRNYMLKYLMPSLTEAMSECCKIKPEDPVDFLAEHLLRNNQKE